jgi:hypothetical protein
MEIISLGGVGGCQLATTLRMHNYPAYPYDWLITSQSFIIDSFDNIDNFFIFDNAYVYDNNYLLDKYKRAIMLHDFTDFQRQKVSTIEKYMRRFHRLHDVLISGKKILFVRVLENMNEPLQPLEFYNSIYMREEEDISLWETFIQKIIDTYHCSCHLLLISNEHKYNNRYNNITISYTNNKIANNISRMITELVESNIL